MLRIPFLEQGNIFFCSDTPKLKEITALNFCDLWKLKSSKKLREVPCFTTREGASGIRGEYMNLGNQKGRTEEFLVP